MYQLKSAWNGLYLFDVAEANKKQLMIAISCILKHNTIKVICPLPLSRAISSLHNLMMSVDVIEPPSGHHQHQTAAATFRVINDNCYNNKEIKLIGSGNILLIISCPFHTLSQLCL